jgi:dihydroorotate dehydrogenase
MPLLETAAVRLLRRLDPETAHGLAIAALRAGLGPRGGPETSSRLRTRLAGLDLPNPVGLAAGFDKNAQALPGLLAAGFGFVEAGAVTPLPQPGNDRPRVFRLPEAEAVINRFGFNNDGATAVASRLAAHRPGGIVGLNLGANKHSADRAADFARVLRVCGPHVDFATVNVSSPNTAGLRDLQGQAMAPLLEGVLAAREDLPRRIPVFLKIAPDLDDAQIAQIAAAALAAPVDGIIATNTTIARDGLTGRHAAQAGGLSGRPLFARSTRVLARLFVETGAAMPLIGVGGIGSADDAWAKIEAGATAVQLYTALGFRGLSLVGQIARGLDARLSREGLDGVADAVGRAAQRWAAT